MVCPSFPRPNPTPCLLHSEEQKRSEEQCAGLEVWPVQWLWKGSESSSPAAEGVDEDKHFSFTFMNWINRWEASSWFALKRWAVAVTLYAWLSSVLGFYSRSWLSKTSIILWPYSSKRTPEPRKLRLAERRCAVSGWNPLQLSGNFPISF